MLKIPMARLPMVPIWQVSRGSLQKLQSFRVNCVELFDSLLTARDGSQGALVQVGGC